MARVSKLLTRRKAWWMNVHGSAYMRAGIPDIVACYKGRFLAFEVKRPQGVDSKASPIQEYELGKINLAGGMAHVVRSVEDAQRILDEVDCVVG